MISTGFLFGVSLFFIVLLAFSLLLVFFAFANMVQQKNTFKKLYLDCLAQKRGIAIENSMNRIKIEIYQKAIRFFDNQTGRCMVPDLFKRSHNSILVIYMDHVDIKERGEEIVKEHDSLYQKAVSAIDKTANLGPQ